MTPKNNVDPEGDDSLGMLDDTASSDTIAIGPLGGTAQVSVTLPTGGDDDDLVDEQVVEGEVISDLIIDTSAVADEDTLARISQETPDFVIELPAEELPAPAAPAEQVELETEEPVAAEEPVTATEDVVDAVIVADADDAPSEPVAAATPAQKPATPAQKPATKKPAAKKSAAKKSAASDAGKSAHTSGATSTKAAKKPARPAEREAVVAPDAAPATVDTSAEPKPAPRAETDPHQEATPDTPAPKTPRGRAVKAEAPLSPLEAAVAAAKADLREAMTPNPSKPAEPARPRTPITPEEGTAMSNQEPAPQPTPARTVAREANEHSSAPAEVVLASKRLDDLSDAGRESADLLTADRLLDPSRVVAPEPEGTWSQLLYSLSGGRINVGDSRKARERKQLSARIAAPLSGTARFVPVLSRKGGVGKTTVTALLGMALADAREDRVIAVDANPDRGTLAERVVGSHTRSVRDLVRAQEDIRGFHDISALVARDETRLDVLASDADPHVSEAFGDADYRDVATVAAQYYSIVLTDSGTGIVHSVMGATLDLADQIVIVSGLSVDEARLASETLTWLETNGRAQLAREAIVVLNQSTPGAPLVRLSELESHFSTRAKHVLRIPYDTQIAGGGAIDFASLQPATRMAAREIAAALIEGLRAKAS